MTTNLTLPFTTLRQTEPFLPFPDDMPHHSRPCRRSEPCRSSPSHPSPIDYDETIPARPSRTGDTPVWTGPCPAAPVRAQRQAGPCRPYPLPTTSWANPEQALPNDDPSLAALLRPIQVRSTTTSLSRPCLRHTSLARSLPCCTRPPDILGRAAPALSHPTEDKMYRIHWTGGLDTPSQKYLFGWPCCVSGPRARIIREAGMTTTIKRHVTCRKCLRNLRNAGMIK